MESTPSAVQWLRLHSPADIPGWNHRPDGDDQLCCGGSSFQDALARCRVEHGMESVSLESGYDTDDMGGGALDKLSRPGGPTNDSGAQNQGCRYPPTVSPKAQHIRPLFAAFSCVSGETMADAEQEVEASLQLRTAADSGDKAQVAIKALAVDISTADSELLRAAVKLFCWLSYGGRALRPEHTRL
ncbi:hypothetical protein PG994_009286 [Apiospora phragmitis]|uniref:Uncharacterized protein n=1 Tax=Apiospora phragmitis TaxID=2905665 RepID=A0ABR1UIV1_9PEZI